MKPYKVIISGGGTGGHIYPALAIAKEIERRYPDAELLFVGAEDRMEMEKVPQAGYEIKGLWISGIQRKLSWKNLVFPFKLLSSLWKANRILKQFKPDIVIGTGGFASGPLLRAATRKGIPALIQEQNSYAGITNKWLSASVEKICVAYEHMERYFPEEKIVITGNPVREDLLDIDHKRTDALAKYDLPVQATTVLVMGGSLGARAINAHIAKRLPFFKKMGVQLLWQTGKLYYEQYKHLEDESVQVMPYIDQMDLAYAAADVIISRAGASSVSELCIVGKAVIFIPSPNVAEDHQTKNAQAIVQHDAAVLLPERDLDERFETVVSPLLQQESLRQALGAEIKKLARPEATASIVDEVEHLLAKGQ